MEISEKAQTYADACVAGDIVSESQAPYLARNFQALIDEYQKHLRAVFDDMWILLDAVAMEADDTLWYNGGTTAHERLCEMAVKYDTGVAAELEKRLESC